LLRAGSPSTQVCRLVRRSSPNTQKVQINQVVTTYLQDLGRLAEGESIDIDDLLSETNHLSSAQSQETKNPSSPTT